LAESTTHPVSSGARRASLLVKCAVSVLLLGVLLWRTDREVVLHTIRSLRVLPLLGAVALYWVTQILSSRRWQLLLRVQGVHIPAWRLVLFYLEGMFLGLFTPATVGSDLARAYRVHQETGGKQVALASILVERLSGLSALVTIALVTLLLSWDGTAAWQVFGATCVFVLGLVTVFSRALWAWMSAIVSRLGLARIGGMLDAVAEGIGRYRGHKRVLGGAFVQSLVLQVIIIYAYSLTALALDLSVPLRAFLLLLPIVTIVTMLPISIAGLGVREGAMVYLFAQIGLPSTVALSLSLTWFLVAVLASLPGGLVFTLLDHSGHRPLREPSVAGGL